MYGASRIIETHGGWWTYQTKSTPNDYWHDVAKFKNEDDAKLFAELKGTALSRDAIMTLVKG